MDYASKLKWAYYQQNYWADWFDYDDLNDSYYEPGMDNVDDNDVDDVVVVIVVVVVADYDDDDDDLNHNFYSYYDKLYYSGLSMNFD